MNELLGKLCPFVGYGSQKAKVIFVGTEEYTYDSDFDIYKKRLFIQSQLHPYTDLNELCSKLTYGLHNPQRYAPQLTWKPLCSIMLGIENQTYDEKKEGFALIKYQREQLGRNHGDSLLAELLPVPKSCVKSFTDIHMRLLEVGSLNEYHQLVLQYRQNLLAKMLGERLANSPPRLIVAYGASWWKHFKEIFQKAHQILNLENTLQYNDDDQPVKCNGWRKPRFIWTRINQCLLVLACHPRCQDERKFDDKVARRIVEIYHEGIGQSRYPMFK